MFEPLWLSGKAVARTTKQTDLVSNPISSLFYSKSAVCLLTSLPPTPTINEAVKWPILHPIWMQKVCFRDSAMLVALSQYLSLPHHHHQSLNRERSLGHHRWFCNQFSPFFPGTCQTPGLSIPWCCLPTSSFVHLVFFSLTLCLARLFWPDLMNRRHDHSTAVYVSLPWSGGLRVVWSPAGSWHGLPLR